MNYFVKDEWKIIIFFYLYFILFFIFLNSCILEKKKEWKKLNVMELYVIFLNIVNFREWNVKDRKDINILY